MEAIFFQSLSRALGPGLLGSRLDKIHAPLPSTWAIALSSRECGKQRLFLQIGSAAGLLFLSSNHPENPLQPSAQVMWMRKRALGRRLVSWHDDWPRRRLAWELSPCREPDARRFLLLDLRRGLLLVDELPEEFGRPPAWPELDKILADPDIWREYPQVSPPLRRTLGVLPAEDAARLYELVRSGRADRFYLYDGPAGPDEVLAWPLPEQLRKGRAERVLDDPALAATACGEARLFAAVGREERRDGLDAAKAKRRRIKKSLARVEEDMRRLETLARYGLWGEALKANLHRFGDARVPAKVRLDHPGLGSLDVELDPRLTAVGNMERLFRLAAKARRGMPVVERRREDLLRQLDTPDDPEPEAQASAPAAVSAAGAAPLPQRFKSVPCHVYRLSGGFLALRGKNDKANHALLSRAASPFDLWFHVSGGPGAHVILKRDYPAQEVPEEALEQAAVLAALASYRAGDAKAEVMRALVKDVRKNKGAAPGQVAVDEASTMLVSLDPALDAALRAR